MTRYLQFTMEDYTPPQPWLKIIYKDDYIMAVNKPSGLLSVPGRGEAPNKRDSIMTRVLHSYPEAVCVHRLDMETSGIMVIAMTKRTGRNLSKQFQKHLTHKFYIARVWGHPESDEGVIKLPLTVDWPNRPLHKVCFATGKPSETRYQVLTRDADSTSRLLLMPLTGRTHQLRVHLQSVGHTILGDQLYASADIRALAPRMLLHAETLVLRHPKFNTPFHVYCKAEF